MVVVVVVVMVVAVVCGYGADYSIDYSNHKCRTVGMHTLVRTGCTRYAHPQRTR